MNERFDIVERWPELFSPLTQAQRDAVVRALAGGWHEGWNPNREDVQTSQSTPLVRLRSPSSRRAHSRKLRAVLMR